MKASELVYLFTEELARTKIEKRNSPSLPFITRAYAMVLKHLNDNFHSAESINTTKINELHITRHMKDKLIKLLSTKVKEDPHLKKKLLRNDLRKIIGIGPQKADDLIAQGLTSLGQLKQPRWWNQLNIDTQTALATEPVRRIPHDEIKQIEPILTKFSSARIILVGSYRRKMPSSKDIDVMLVSARTAAMGEYLKYLEKKFPHIYLYSKGGDKMSLVIETDTARNYKVDVFRTHPDYYWSHLLYATGSKANNLRMRTKAKRMGLLLNQKGLWKAGERVLGPTANERAYYIALDMDYLPPEKRN
jgi:DNA polymerase/3'-5' exonuclease PolX